MFYRVRVYHDITDIMDFYTDNYAEAIKLAEEYESKDYKTQIINEKP